MYMLGVSGVSGTALKFLGGGWGGGGSEGVQGAGLTPVPLAFALLVFVAPPRFLCSSWCSSCCSCPCRPPPPLCVACSYPSLLPPSTPDARQSSHPLRLVPSPSHITPAPLSSFSSYYSWHTRRQNCNTRFLSDTAGCSTSRLVKVRMRASMRVVFVYFFRTNKVCQIARHVRACMYVRMCICLCFITFWHLVDGRFHAVRVICFGTACAPCVYAIGVQTLARTGTP